MKKNIMNSIEEGISGEASADALFSQADVLASPASVPSTKIPIPTLDAEAAKKVTDMALRGNIPMRIVQGTEVLKNINSRNPNINQGGVANHTNQVYLKLDLASMTKVK